MSETTMEQLKEARILIVDDEASNIKLLERMLKNQGYTNLVPVQDSRQFMTTYQQAPTDLILLDLNMPHIDGFAVMQQLKSLGERIAPPVVVLTAQHHRDFLLKALEHGARDFIPKPFDRSELVIRVRNLLEAHMAHRLIEDHNRLLEEEVRRRNKSLRESRLQVVQRLGRAAEYRDNETGNHILRMSHMAALLAQAVGWDEKACEMILHASPMHDIGKIGIPDDILLKPGRLTADEWQVMKTHTTIGADILSGDESELLGYARSIALTHHEKWDGSGYPNGLAGEAIPIEGRITALADVFDALTSERPYKKAWSVEEAVDLIRSESGKQFDPQLVDLFIENLPGMLAIRERFSEP